MGKKEDVKEMESIREKTGVPVSTQILMKKKGYEIKQVCYSHVCKLCGEEIVWSITEHILDKHGDIPEAKVLRAWIAMLWAKFVESQ